VSAEAFQVDSTFAGDSQFGLSRAQAEPRWSDADRPTFDPALSTRGPLTSLRTVMYLSTVAGRLVAKSPIKVEVSPSQEGRFSVFAPVLGLGGVADTLEAAAQDLASTVESLWDSLVEENPESLTSDAILLADRLRSTFDLAR
jgi:hypothetical protein